MDEAPWLILTLRRTGGTSFTTFLSEVSSFQTIEHEPFNMDRMLGYVTKGFRDTQDLEAASTAMRAALAGRPNIKHCFEIVPMEITRLLIDEAQRLGYKIFLLTRQNEDKRLASLFLAISTGAWGPEQAAQIYPQIISGDFKPAPIDPRIVRNRAHLDARLLGNVLCLLRNRQVRYHWLLFEELYFGDTPLEEQVLEVSQQLGITVAADDPRLTKVSKSSGQKSASIASFVENYAEALKVLEDACPK